LLPGVASAKSGRTPIAVKLTYDVEDIGNVSAGQTINSVLTLTTLADLEYLSYDIGNIKNATIDTTGQTVLTNVGKNSEIKVNLIIRVEDTPCSFTVSYDTATATRSSSDVTQVFIGMKQK
jgi:hypothetical protein